jgi:hypothetical protein
MGDKKAEEAIENLGEAAIRELLQRGGKPPVRPDDWGTPGAKEVTHVVSAVDTYEDQHVLVDLDHPSVRDMEFDDCDIKDFQVGDRVVRAYVSFRVGLAIDRTSS